jgi:hypothetical protein
MNFFAVLGGVSAFILIFALFVIRNRKRFEKRYPPISDAEFLARCKPGTNPDVALKVRRFVSEQLAVEYERVFPETKFKDLGVE